MAPKKGKAKDKEEEDKVQHESLRALSDLFPVTHPFPDPLQDQDLIPASDVTLEQDILLNSANPRTWNAYIEHVLSSNRPTGSDPFFRDADSHLSSALVKLLGPMSSSSNRLGLRRLTFAYERALATFPTSYILWKDYLLHRMRYVMGNPHGGLDAFWKKQIRLGKEKLDVGPTLVDGKDPGQEEWDWGLATGAIGPLDGRIGNREWESLAAVFERALMYLPKVSTCG